MGHAIALKLSPEMLSYGISSEDTPELYSLKVPIEAKIGRFIVGNEFIIDRSELGINDPTSHLYKVLESIQSSDKRELGKTINDIRSEFMTDVGERLPNTPFINEVNFIFSGNDFISVNDHISMAAMTDTNMRIFKELSYNNPTMLMEYARAKLEAQEIEKLSDWFPNAPIGACMVFESLPIGEQKKNGGMAIPRLYTKVSRTELRGEFLSLYNQCEGSNFIDNFNKMRDLLGIGSTKGTTELDILESNYEINNPDPAINIIDRYRAAYDEVLSRNDGKQYKFGLQTDNNTEPQNGIFKAKDRPRLIEAYTNMIELLANSYGIVTAGLLQLADKLDITDLKQGETITTDIARSILKATRLEIIYRIDMGDYELSDRKKTDNSSGGDGVSSFTSDRSSYESQGCPEYSQTSTTESTNNNSESNILNNSFNSNEILKNFGESKRGICRIPNCPSHGKNEKKPQKTKVGGCSVCVTCHILFNKGKSPTEIHKKTREYEAKKQIAEEQKTKDSKKG